MERLQIIDVKLNNRKTKTVDNKKNLESALDKTQNKNTASISSLVSEKILGSDKSQTSNEVSNKYIDSQKFNKKNNDRSKCLIEEKAIFKKLQ